MNNYKFPAMKSRTAFSLLLLIFLSGTVFAQGTNRERLEAYKIGFLTKRLNLTPQEAEKFWPVYNAYQEQRNRIQRERQEINRNFNQNELNMTEREMADAGDRVIELEVKEAGLAQDFHKKIKSILSPAKVLRLYQAENQYKIQLLNELKERNQGKRFQNTTE